MKEGLPSSVSSTGYSTRREWSISPANKDGRSRL